MRKGFVSALLAIVGLIMVSIAVMGCATAPSQAASSSSPWNLKGSTVIDLSRVQDQTVPADPALKKATLEFFARVGQGEGAFWNLEVISYVPHVGTHMDSPFHVNSSWGAIETMDPTLLIGPAVVLDVKVPQSNYSITAADIKAAEARGSPILAGDAVLLKTGHGKYWPDKATYIDGGYPILAADAAEYIVSRKARFVGMETISPDGPNTVAHKILMGGGCIVVENLCNLEQLGPRTNTIGTFANVRGATGVWIRLLAVK
jgi:arylformamidase